MKLCCACRQLNETTILGPKIKRLAIPMDKERHICSTCHKSLLNLATPFIWKPIREDALSNTIYQDGVGYAHCRIIRKPEGLFLSTAFNIGELPVNSFEHGRRLASKLRNRYILRAIL